MTEPDRTPDADSPAPPAPPQAKAPRAPAGFPDQFAPRATDGREGLLRPASAAVDPEALRTPLVTQLTEFARLAIDWPAVDDPPDARIGDYRFLIVEFTPADGILRYAQIWSEPKSELLMEVGPGDREDPALQRVADGLAPSLAGRGFAIGGNAGNFRKALAIPRVETAPAIAAELAALLIDVLGFDGSVDLAYQLRQATFLEERWVTLGMARSGLADLLHAWGIACTASPETVDVLDAHSHRLRFHLQLHALHSGKKGTYWEIHPFAEIRIAHERVQELLVEVNDRMTLFKAWPTGEDAPPTRRVRFATAINLAGGVTLAHIRCHLFGWLDAVRQLADKYRAAPAAAAEPEPPLEVEGHTVH